MIKDVFGRPGARVGVGSLKTPCWPWLGRLSENLFAERSNFFLNDYADQPSSRNTHQKYSFHLYSGGTSPPKLVTGCNPNDLDIWTDWCRLGLQFVVYKSAEQEWSFMNYIFVALIWLANV